MEEFMNSLVATLSFGNRQKVAIISASLHNPKVLILDEL
ncbi:MAG: ATP-binding cassette domain-containing protein [Archaeoglobaceae archaeon]